MVDIIVKSFEELKEAVDENLKDGTVITVDISGKGEGSNDEGDGA